ncbi:hypothetical protein KEF29_27860 [Streptomyces tuirus]|uniref:2Fe-2S ferredoxin-type domain-containing protein n=1 Tax=Streptomyces tuirus TaxID=68278 RepID=A0A941J0M9_9ACTN|nr:hypothetical protein [Streptomyces tuirus]
MTDDQHGEGTPRGGGRWDPLPQGEYDDGATAFVELPEGGVDALLAADSPLAAPGHGYVPPQITVDPATTAGTDPAATGWPVPGAPVDGAQWHDPHAAHQQGHEHGGHQQQGHDTGERAYDAPYGSGTPYGSGAGAGQHGGDDRFTYHPGATGQWNFEEAATAETAPGHDVTGQWSIPVAGGDLPDESGEYTTSSLVEQWGGTPPPTLPGGAPAPWATQAAGRPWGQQDPAAQEQAGPGYPHEHGRDHGRQDAAGPASGYAPDQVTRSAPAPEQPPLPREPDPTAGQAPGTPESGRPGPQRYEEAGPYEDAGQAPESSGFAGHGPESPGAEHTRQPYEEAGPYEDAGHAPESSGFAGRGPESPGAEHTRQPYEEAGPYEDAGHAPESSGFAGRGPESPGAEHARQPSGEAGHVPGEHGAAGHAAEPMATGPAPERSDFPGHGPESSGFPDHGSEPSRFTGHGPEQPPFADHGPEPSTYADHGSDPSRFPGHGQEPSGVAAHGPEPSGVPGHSTEPSGPAGGPVEHPAAAAHGREHPGAGQPEPAAGPQPYPETPGEIPGAPAPEAHAEAAAPPGPAQEASQSAPGPGEAGGPAEDAPEAAAGAGGPAEPPAGPLPALADTDAAAEPADAEPPNDPASDAPAAQPDEASHDTPPTMPQEEHPLASYVLRVNGAERPVTDAWIGESLLYVLRERLGLAGAKDGCSQGECGACNVQVDGRLVASCLVPAVTAAGSEVRTVEGLAEDGQPSDVQRALARCGAVQCGFCVPGMAMTVHDLLEGNPAPTELETRQALCGNLCRCSGYRGVVDAVQEVVAEREAHAAPADGDAEEARIPHQAGPGAGGVNPSAFGLPPGAEPHAPDAHSPDPHDQSHGQDGGPA